MASKTAFVTGATGFLGSNLVEVLVENGWRVVALHRSSSNLTRLRELEVDLVEGDILDREGLEGVIPEGTEALFHVAADTSMWSRAVRRQTRINVLGTRNVVAAALARGVGRLVHTSSIAVYGFQSRVITEESPRLGGNSWIGYYRTKALAEREVRLGVEGGLDAVIMNPANIIGAYDAGNWSRLFLMVKNGRLPGAPPGSGSFCHAREAARAHVAAWERGRTGENYLLGGDDATYLEVIREIARLVGEEEPRRAAPAWFLRMAGRGSLWGSYITGREPDLTPEAVAIVTGHAYCSSKKAIHELGFTPVPLARMLEDCHRWMVESGLLS